MEMELIMKIFFLGIVHWILVPIAMTKLIDRQGALGRLKGLWAPAILFLTCVGPLAYLIIHELVPRPQTQVDYERYYDNLK
jgi:hypothetical protein